MRTLALFIFTAICFSSSAQEAEHKAGELLIQLKSGTPETEFIRTFETETQLNVYSFECLSPIAGMYHVVFTDKSIDLNKTIELFYGYKEVLNAQKNHLIQQRETVPNDALFSGLWHYKNTGQTGGTVDADIDGTEAWDITTGGTTTHDDTIVVCIIEGSGVDIVHEDIIDNVWHNHAEIPNNGTDDDGNGYIDDFDGWNVGTLDDDVGAGNHGTRVAGMVGAKGNNSLGVSGVNWDVKMMIIKGQVATDEASVLAAYNYPLVMRKKYNETFGAEGAFVVSTNASWGINNGQPVNFPLWCAMYDTLGAYGILNVAATTNSNIDVDANGDMPTACPSNYLIGVTMTDHDDVRANSGYGPTHVDLGAPGYAVELPVPGNSYTTTNGTSFASPCVAGAVALAYASPCAEFIAYAKNDPSAAALDMRDYILSTVDVIPALTGEVGTNGRLNMFNILDSIMNACNVSTCNQPYNLHAIYMTDTTAKFKWDGFSTDFLFYIQEGANPIVEIPLTNTDTIQFDTLLPCTPYTVWVKSICGIDTSDFSFPISFTSDGCCNNPDLALDYSTADSLTVSWTDILYGTQYDIIYKDTNLTTWDTLYNVSSPLTLDGLDTCTIYEVQIKTTCTDSTQGFSPSFIFGTQGCGACFEAAYCDVLNPNANSEWIDSIVIGWAVSATGSNNGWLQSTDILESFEPGLTYPVTLKPGYSGTTFTERFTIWIDTDFNGVFDPAEALLQNVTTTSIINDNITIPAGAQHGITKMRIGMNGTSNPDACPDSFWGEYEDYCVYIGLDASTAENENLISVYPNPATEVLNILSSSPLSEVSIYTQEGKLVKRTTSFLGQIDISDLAKGMYILTLQTENGSSVHKFVKQ